MLFWNVHYLSVSFNKKYFYFLNLKEYLFSAKNFFRIFKITIICFDVIVSIFITVIGNKYIELSKSFWNFIFLILKIVVNEYFSVYIDKPFIALQMTYYWSTTLHLKLDVYYSEKIKLLILFPEY